MKPPIRILLFGKFTARLGEQALLYHLPPKAQELLAYLVLHRGKAHPREALGEVLWGERDTPNTRKYLRQALWQLHAGLVSIGRRRAARLLNAQSDWLQLDLDDRVEADIVHFEQAFSGVRSARGSEMCCEQARELAELAQLYRGDLLEGWPAEWCVYDRDRYRRMYLTVLDQLADHYEARHGYDAVIAYATLALQYDPTRERSHRSTMRALAKSGDRSAALRQYDRCVESLRDELDVDPEPETIVLEQMIRAGRVVGAVREAIPGSIGSSRSQPDTQKLAVVRPRARAAGTDRRQ